MGEETIIADEGSKSGGRRSQGQVEGDSGSDSRCESESANRRSLRKNLTAQQPRDALLDGSDHWLADSRERRDGPERNEGFFEKKLLLKKSRVQLHVHGFGVIGWRRFQEITE